MSTIDPLEKIFDRSVWDRYQQPMTSQKVWGDWLPDFPFVKVFTTNLVPSFNKGTNANTKNFGWPDHQKYENIYTPLIKRIPLQDHPFGEQYMNERLRNYQQYSDGSVSTIYWQRNATTHLIAGNYIQPDIWHGQYSRDFWYSDLTPTWPLTNNQYVANWEIIPPWDAGPPLAPDCGDGGGGGGSVRPDYGLLYPRKV